MRKIFLFVVLTFLFSSFSFSSNPRSFIEVKKTDIKDLRHFKDLGLDIAGINRQTDMAGVIATQEEINKLKSEGYEVFIRETEISPSAAALEDYYDNSEILAALQEAAAAYPEITKLMTISEELWEGNFVYAIKITKDVNEENDRPTFFFDSQHHAREVMTSQIGIDMVDYLTTNYGTDPEVTDWVDNINIIIVPMVNPDGSDYVFSNDRWWRKNRHPDCAVDLNRNYGWNWNACNGSSGWCRDETYRGESPASEPETQAMEKLMEENPAIFALTYHSYGEYILFPLGCYDPSEIEAYYEVGNELNSILENDQGHTGMYDTGPGWDTIYPTDGTSDDTHYGKYGTFSYCIEVNGSGFQPDYGQWRDITVERQRTAWKFFLDKTLTAPMVKGLITDANTGSPLAAFVDVAEVPLTAGEDLRHASEKGLYARVVPKNRVYHLTFSAPGYSSQTAEVSIAESPVNLDISLVPSGGSIPVNPFPANAAVNQDVSVTLSWDGTAESYSLHFGDNQSPQLLTTVSAESYTLTGLEYGKTYYWRVDPSDTGGSTTGNLWSFSTYKYGIDSVRAIKNPFRLDIAGHNFTYECVVKIDGGPVPKSTCKSPERLIAKKGKLLKDMLPRGVPVTVVIEDGSGGTSKPLSFTR